MKSTAYKNIFKEYNIPRDAPKKRKKSFNLTPKNKSFHYNEDHAIENLSEDENLSSSFQYVQLKRSFDHSLNVVPSQVKNNSLGNAHHRSLLQGHGEDDDDGDDAMPRPIVIKEEPSQDIHLTWESSSVGSIASTVTNVTERQLKLQETLDSSCRATRLRKSLSLSNSDSITHPTKETNKTQPNSLDSSSCRNSRHRQSISLSNSHSITTPTKETTYKNHQNSPKRYQSLDISIIKKTTPRRSPRIAALTGLKNKSPSCRKNLNSSWPSSDEEPFQNGSPSNADKEFACSSPMASQIIQTPSSSTASPRKTPTKPSELDLMVELIEKENAEKRAKAKKSPRKFSKRPITGGFVELYERHMAKAKSDSKFLKHDKKYGLASGVILRVIKLEFFHGVHVAKVKRVEGKDSKTFAIVVPNDFMTQLKPNSRIETFFDETTQPYKLSDPNGGVIEVYVKPHKLLLL